MQKGTVKSAAFLAGVLFFATANASAQQLEPRSPKPAGSAEGTLTVTATIVSSTGVVVGPDGQQHIILANGPDPKDSALLWQADQAVKVVLLSPVTGQKQDAKPESGKPKRP